jgi:hypothetical protein
LDSRGEYSRAFEYMQQAHRIQGRETQFNLEGEKDKMRRIQSVLSSNFITSHADSGLRDTRPVLVSGMPRSGTTLAEQVLASHPGVVGKGERMALGQAAGKLCGGNYPESLLTANPDQMHAEGERFVADLCRDTGDALRVVDTTPMNFRFTGLAASILPDARFIHCKRNAMDNCLSLYRQMLTGPVGFEHDLGTLGAYYRLQADLLTHWQKVLGDRLYVLEYEKLVQKPEVEIRKLLEFCGLEFDPACLEFHQSSRVIKSPSASQVRQPIYNSSVGAWKRYEKQLQPLAKALEYE